MSTFLTAEWRKLIMAQYEVSPATLAPYLPRGLEFDLYEGRCYVSLVGFLFDRVRLKGLPIPFHTRFEEINLRFYVTRRQAPTGIASESSPTRGVVFIREFVPRRAIALVAKYVYEEPYLTIPTRHAIEQTSSALNVSYAWKLGNRWHSLAVSAAPTPQPIAPGSEEDFITDHFWGYTKRSDASTSAYEVQHPRWQIYPLTSHKIDVDFAALYGSAFAHLNHAEPMSVLLAEGSAVSVLSGFRL